MPAPSAVAYACDLIIYINLENNTIKINKNRYFDDEIVLYLQQVLKKCSRIEKIKSFIYDKD